ncbi:MAG: transposase [SAR324 cluster bacterium]|nr:transposase [SAR324 cluster bacterium]
MLLSSQNRNPIQRRKDYDTQKENYSGKKKRHSKKNLVVVDLDRKVHVLSQTQNGSSHDYQMFKDSNIGNQIPKEIVVAVDSGFTGILKDYPNLRVLIPEKNRKTGN